MATVYVITRGDYSDYHICAVTLDKKKAKKLAKMYTTSYDNAIVEKWETDTETDINALKGRYPYSVTFREDGSVDTFKHHYDYETFCEGFDLSEYWGLRVNLYAPDAESAIKIAAEKRAKYLAEKEGIS